MKNYLEQSGLDFSLGENKLNYIPGDFAPAVEWDKSLEAGKYAYADSSHFTDDLDIIYYGNRYMEKTSDAAAFTGNDFMADVTVIKPGKIGKEYVKTVGHYHGYVPNTDTAYPEVYEAISGKFEYLLQSEPLEDGSVDVIWVVAEEGDKVVMPPGYGHVSMNVGDEPAVELDIQKRDNPNQSDYSMFKENVGGALYRTEEGLQENPNYKINSVRIVRPLEKADWGITKTKPLYTSFVENPKQFDWLLHPQNYTFDLNELFEDIEL